MPVRIRRHFRSTWLITLVVRYASSTSFKPKRIYEQHVNWLTHTTLRAMLLLSGLLRAAGCAHSLQIYCRGRRTHKFIDELSSVVFLGGINLLLSARMISRT